MRGEVTPSAEICSSRTNESCDGTAGCTGLPSWSKRFGDGDSQFGRSVAVDKAGNVYLTGTFDGTLNFGGGALSGFHSIYLAKFDSAGNHLWSKNLGGILQFATVFVDVAPDQSPIVAGDYNGTLTLGGGISLTNNDGANAFVAKFDSSGNAVWAKQFGDTSGQTVTAANTDSAGNILLGALPGTGIDFGGGNLTGTAVLAKLDSAGNHVWSKAFTVTGMNGMSVRGVGTDTSGNVYFGGALNGMVNLGGANLTSAGPDVRGQVYFGGRARVE
ncbi:MAG: SBBP repeat-containing protein [Polyangiaceae bacterium]|nr:SBBP repeat-containing protein [Polyangiaceae bacterium]